MQKNANRKLIKFHNVFAVNQFSNCFSSEAFHAFSNSETAAEITSLSLIFIFKLSPETFPMISKGQSPIVSFTFSRFSGANVITILDGDSPKSKLSKER